MKPRIQFVLAVTHMVKGKDNPAMQKGISLARNLVQHGLHMQYVKYCSKYTSYDDATERYGRDSARICVFYLIEVQVGPRPNNRKLVVKSG